MKSMVVTFRLPTIALSIRVHDPAGTPPHERLRELHQAANAWAARHTVRIHSEVASEPPPDTHALELTEYLYADGEMNAARVARHFDMLQSSGAIHRFTARPGATVEARDLVGRDAVSQQLLEAVATSTSCHLAAPRRYGKTSLLRHLQRTQRSPTVFVDLSPGDSALSFLVAVASAAMQCEPCRPSLLGLAELSGWPSDPAPMERVAAANELSDRIRANPLSFGRRLLGALAECGAILLLDEFSVFLRASLQRAAGEAQALARLLAEFRSAQPALVQVFSGSEGLTSYIRFHSLGPLFSGLKNIQLPPLDPRDGLVLAEELCYGMRRRPTRQAVTAILDEVGEPVPYFIHVLVDAIYAALPGPDIVTPELVHEAYRERVLGPLGNYLFRTYALGSQPYPEQLRGAAAKVLRSIVKHAEGCTEDEMLARSTMSAAELRSLLACLQEDYDLIEESGRWRMRSKVLRERWALSEAWLTTAE